MALIAQNTSDPVKAKSLFLMGQNALAFKFSPQEQHLMIKYISF